MKTKLVSFLFIIGLLIIITGCTPLEVVPNRQNVGTIKSDQETQAEQTEIAQLSVTKSPQVSPTITTTPKPPTQTFTPPPPTEISGELLWFAPNFSRHLPENPDQDNECWDLFFPGASWSQAKNQVDVIQIDQTVLTSYKDEGGGFPLPLALEFINGEGMSLSVQVIGPGNGVCSGEEAAARDLQDLAKIPQLKGEINFIVIPAPIEKMISHGYDNNCSFTFEQAAEQLSLYIISLREQFPTTKIGIFEPLRGYSAGDFPQTQDTYYHGEFRRIFERILSVLESHDETIDFFHVSSPDEVIGTTWGGWLAGKVYEIGGFFNSRGIRYGLIYFTKRGGVESDTQFFEDTRISKEYILLVEENHDTFLMNYILQSYLEHPSKCLPENEPYTFTNLISEFENFTTSPTRTPRPTFDNPWVMQQQCLDHEGCQRVEVKNQSDYWVNILLESLDTWTIKSFSIPPRGHAWITLLPGQYRYEFTSCGGDVVYQGYHAINQHWYLRFKQKWCE